MGLQMKTKLGYTWDTHFRSLGNSWIYNHNDNCWDTLYLHHCAQPPFSPGIILQVPRHDGSATDLCCHLPPSALPSVSPHLAMDPFASQ